MLSEPNGNGRTSTKHVMVDRHEEGELQFGWRTFRPKSLQILNKPMAFIILIIICSSFQVMLSEMLPVVMLTLKIRFKLSSKDENTLTVLRGISAMLAVIVIGYFGAFRNKIRWITAGMIITGIGGIFFAMPHFIIDDHEPTNLPRQTLMMFGLCGFPPIPCDETAVEHSHMALFVIGQMLIGAGLAPLYCLVPAYIDENVSPRSMPVYIMLWFCNLILAPVSGMISSSMFLNVYIDIKQPDLLHKMTPDDFRWLGSWWLGFLIFGILSIASASVILGFPERLPGSRTMRIESMKEGYILKNDPKMTRQPSGIFHATASLLKNKTFIFNTMALCCIAFYFSAFGPFLLRVIMIKYGAHPTKIAVPFLIVLFFGSIAGLILGGILVKRIGLKNVAKGAAFVCLITQTLALFTPLLFVIPGCNDSNIAGVSIQYPPLGKTAMLKQSGTSELTATCNAQCKCSTFMSKPVCGSNNVAYFDPCHAGCIARPSEKHYTNCTCIPPSKPGYIGGDAKLGFCDRGCKSWLFFLVVMFFCLVIIGSNAVPNKVVILRCVPHNQRCYGLAFQSFFYILVALVPGHLIKYIMEKDCNIWQTDSCGRKGICWDYKANSMSKSMTIFGILVSAMSMIFYFMSWYFYETPRTTKNGRLLSDMTDVLEEYDDSKETNL